MSFIWRVIGLVLALPLAPLAFAVLSCAPGQSAAQSLPAAEGRPVLTLKGNISHKNPDGVALFSLQSLEALPQHSFTIATPWYTEPVKFSGPLLRDVLAKVDAQGTALTAAAIDDFVVEIPISDVRSYDVVLATKINDKPMSVRERGPLFIIYPLDSDPALRSKLIYDRCIWQLKSLTVH